MQEILHSIGIEQRKTINISGVESVKAFSENRIELILIGTSTRLFISGTNLRITGFTKQTGIFTATGNVESLRYGGGLRSRIFK